MFKRVFILFLLSACVFKKENDTKVNEVISEDYEVARWKNFANSAITHTWDDYSPNQEKVALPIYDRFGVKVTFFVIVNFNPDWKKLKEIVANGHEVASHTMSHPKFPELKLAEVEAELKDSKEAIERALQDTCVTMAFPFCQQETYNLTQKYYIAARGCSGQIESETPKDFMNISAFGCGTESIIKTGDDFNLLAKEALKQKGWITYLFHGIDGDWGYSQIRSTELKKHLQYITSKPKDFWIAPFGTVVKYIKERNNLHIEKLKSTKKNTFKIFISDKLDNAIYNEPITVKKQIYSYWNKALVTQNGVKVTSYIETLGDKKFVVFNVVPDAGEIVISN